MMNEYKSFIDMCLSIEKNLAIYYDVTDIDIIYKMYKKYNQYSSLEPIEQLKYIMEYYRQFNNSTNDYITNNKFKKDFNIPLL